MTNKKLTMFVVVASLLITIIGIFLYNRSTDRVVNLKNDINRNTKQTNQNYTSANEKNIQAFDLNKTVSEKKTNVDLKTLHKATSESLNPVFNNLANVKSNDDLNNVKTDLLQNGFDQKQLDQITKPFKPVPFFGQNQQKENPAIKQLQSLNVALGDFNNKEETIPVIVIVKYNAYSGENKVTTYVFNKDIQANKYKLNSVNTTSISNNN